MIGRETVAYIDIDKYLYNLDFLQKHTKTKVMPVLKANAYGHGATFLAKAAIKEGYDMIAVAFLEEALNLLEQGIKMPMLIFNYFSPKDLKEVLEFSEFIKPTITSSYFLEKACVILGSDVKNFKFHINLDTGINRIGIKKAEIPKLVSLIKKYNVSIEGIYSHFANADEKDDFTHVQFDRFITLSKYFESEGIYSKIKHISNSAGALFFPNYSLDYVRAGIATFGLQPSVTHIEPNLKPILELKSVVSSVHELLPEDTVGYGRTYKAKKRTKTAVIPIGYADGYFRNLSNKGEVLINGKRCKILGRVSMDQIVVDISYNNVSIGDEVVIIGKQKDDNISAEEVAKRAQTINYEITSKITQRVQRRYLKGGNYFEWAIFTWWFNKR